MFRIFLIYYLSKVILKKMYIHIYTKTKIEIITIE